MSEGIGIEMPKYKCHKQVWALKIRDVVCHAHPDPGVSIEEFSKDPKFSGGFLFAAEEGYAPIPFDAEWYRKHRPKPGGYYVVYQDGYKSYSPADAFETGYTRIEEGRVATGRHHGGIGGDD